MKTYKKYTKITVDDALLALAAGDGKPLEGFVFSDVGNEPCEFTGSLAGVTLGVEYNFSDGDNNWKYCHKVKEVNPRAVPAGVTPLPDDEPQLFYMKGPLPNEKTSRIKGLWILSSRGWESGYGELNGLSGAHYAIDVTSDYAAEHFPEIVEAVEYVEEPAPSAYGYHTDGWKICPPADWEIVPEGEKMSGACSGFMLYQDDEWKPIDLWSQGDCDGELDIAKVQNGVRAYARRVRAPFVGEFSGPVDGKIQCVANTREQFAGGDAIQFSIIAPSKEALDIVVEELGLDPVKSGKYQAVAISIGSLSV